MRWYNSGMKRTRRYIVHNPTCIGAGVGDRVKIMECRPLSKTKHFCIIEATPSN